MSGLLPLDVAMDRKHLAISYVETRTRIASALGQAGTVTRGQEFHQSRVVEADLEPNLFHLTTSEGETRRAGYQQGGVLASYVHLQLGSAPVSPAACWRLHSLQSENAPGLAPSDANPHRSACRKVHLTPMAFRFCLRSQCVMG